jgi:hypothetical protein
MSARAPATVGDFVGRAASHTAEALRYWEPRRALYNAVLAAVVLAHIAASWPASWAALTWNLGFWLFFLCVLANVCYCAVYLVDAFVQFSGLRDEWRRLRVGVLVVGTAFAAVIAHWFAMGLFAAS